MVVDVAISNHQVRWCSNALGDGHYHVEKRTEHTSRGGVGGVDYVLILYLISTSKTVIIIHPGRW